MNSRASSYIIYLRFDRDKSTQKGHVPTTTPKTTNATRANIRGERCKKTILGAVRSSCGRITGMKDRRIQRRRFLLRNNLPAYLSLALSASEAAPTQATKHPAKMCCLPTNKPFRPQQTQKNARCPPRLQKKEQALQVSTKKNVRCPFPSTKKVSSPCGEKSCIEKPTNRPLHQDNRQTAAP